MQGLFPIWTVAFALMMGASIGSFLNVVIYRMPLGLKLGEPKHSFCPNCNHQLHVPDLVPLFSWLFLGGKCRHCRVPIPPRYFIVELITGSLWAIIWYQNLIVGWNILQAFALFLMVSTLVAATFIDLRWFIIPDQLNAFLLAVGLVVNGIQIGMGLPGAWLWGMPASIAGALVGTFSIWFVTLVGRLLFGKDAMGHGDIKLMRGIGAILLPVGVGLTFAIAIVLGAVLGIVQVLISRKLKSGQEEADSEDDEPYIPESIASIFKCGLGYFLAFDCIGLAIPKFYESWFGENPYSNDDFDPSWTPEPTAIPFGPYLAVGAILAALASAPLMQVVNRYWAYLNGS